MRRSLPRATRDPSNPLDLPVAPGANPLNGANFFVDGPHHRAATGAIAKLVGIDPKRLSDGESSATFKAKLAHGRLHRKLQHNRLLRVEQRDHLQPPHLRAPGQRDGGGIERRPAVILLKLDAVGASRCMARTGALSEWEADIRYEINTVSTLPHAVVYIECGYSDGNPPGYTAQVLNAVGVRNIRGFYTDDTHLNWTANEIRWGDKVSALTGGTHFIINTADNGHGPLLNRHPTKQGNEDPCNPPGRGAGIPTTTDAGNARIDSFMWVHVPGASSGACNSGTLSGTFWLARALTEAHNANRRLGPHFKNEPYCGTLRTLAPRRRAGRNQRVCSARSGRSGSGGPTPAGHPHAPPAGP